MKPFRHSFIRRLSVYKKFTVPSIALPLIQNLGKENLLERIIFLNYCPTVTR